MTGAEGSQMGGGGGSSVAKLSGGGGESAGLVGIESHASVAHVTEGVPQYGYRAGKLVVVQAAPAPDAKDSKAARVIRRLRAWICVCWGCVVAGDADRAGGGDFGRPRQFVR
jgi:hypothetical protein